MRADHIRVFRTAAFKFGCQIVVREQNPLSAQFMGRSGFKPKPIWCHAKTAGNASGPQGLQGLVVDPTICPAAFAADKLADAVKEWRSFSTSILSQRLGFKLNDSVGDPRFGAVLCHGDYLYSDYDLKSVTPFFGERSVIKGRPEEMKYHPNAPIDYTSKIEQDINTFFRQRTGIALIQHGSAANYPMDKGTAEMCDVFLPVSPFHLTEIRTK